MPKNLNITLIQSPLLWESPIDNFRSYNKLLSKLGKGESDVLVLPEMFSTGFSMDAKRLAEEMEGPSMQWMFETAQGLKSAICGSLIIKEEKKYYNRFVWMEPDGHYDHYDKRHLFRMAKEEKTYTPSEEGLVIEYKGWGFCPMVCYDLRFPVWSRNRIVGKGVKARFDYDVLLYVANWPAARSYAWQQLLIARAIENQAYVAGVNRIGKDGNGIEYSGDSVLLNPLGEKISSIKSNKSAVETIELNWKALQDVRKKFPVLMDADAFGLV